MARPKTTGTSPKIEFRIPIAVRDTIDEMAKRRGRPWTRSSLCASWIEEGIAREGPRSSVGRVLSEAAELAQASEQPSVAAKAKRRAKA